MERIGWDLISLHSGQAGSGQRAVGRRAVGGVGERKRIGLAGHLWGCVLRTTYQLYVKYLSEVGKSMYM